MPTIAVAALTCRRPELLSRLLASLENLATPDGCEVFILVVDNAPDMPVRELAESWGRRSGRRLVYALEPEPGIPLARNRALDEAAGLGADLLAFVDDDEFVEPEWLSRLVAHQGETGAVLVGGPVRAVAAEGELSWLGRRVYGGIHAGYLRKERKNARRRARGADGKVTIITNNWLGDLAWLGDHALRFDPELRYSGGEDTALYAAAKRLGAKTSWCPDAIVFETVPHERISLGYQFRRARDQASTSMLRKRREDRRSFVSSLGAIAGKLIVGGALFIAAPFTGGRTLVDGARSFGWGVGYAYALAGRRSRHYQSLAAEVPGRPKLGPG